MVDSNIRSAFEELVFKFDIGNEPDEFAVNEEKLRQNASFRELWSNNFPMDQLLTQRRNTTFD
jgi:hypothetical protein